MAQNQQASKKDNKLTDRSGGTTDAKSDVPTTSSTEGIQPRSTDETGDAGYVEANRSTATKLSRSDTSRVSGTVVSGDTADTSTTQSNGRSQY